MVIKQRILNIAIAIDQTTFCLVTLGGSNPDETLSAAAWRWEVQGKWPGIILRPLIDTILFFDKEHCFESYLSELNRKQLPTFYKDKTTSN